MKIRNIGLVDANITGFSNVGGLIGEVDNFSATAASYAIAISNDFVGGTIADYAGGEGGLIGRIVGEGAFTAGTPSATSFASITNSHSDATVNVIETGSANYDVGGLVGEAASTDFNNVWSTGSVNAQAPNQYNIGGLVGHLLWSKVTNAYATGAVSAGSSSGSIGGLIGIAFDTITFTNNGNTVTVSGPPIIIQNTYATGNVSVGSGSGNIGGLIGYMGGPAGAVDLPITVTNSWASGAVSAPSSNGVGGFIGVNSGTVTNSYWDSYSTGQASGYGYSGGTVTNLNPVTSNPRQSAANYAFGSAAYANFPAGAWVYDNNATRPVGAWEVPVAFLGTATVESAHQVQLIDFNLDGDYKIAQNIDMSGTGGTTDIWGPGGRPLGSNNGAVAFTGKLDGGGNVLANLTMTPGGLFGYAGLFQVNMGTIQNIGLSNVTINAANAYDVGAIAGINLGNITDSFATGTITLSLMSSSYGVAGGLVGYNEGGNPSGGSISQSYATVNLSGGGAAEGGLVGDDEANIDHSYANGIVDPSTGTYTGGLVGQSTGTTGGTTITTSYWDTQLSGQAGACGYVGFSTVCSNVIGLTTAQTMQSSASRASPSIPRAAWASRGASTTAIPRRCSKPS